MQPGMTIEQYLSVNALINITHLLALLYLLTAGNEATC